MRYGNDQPGRAKQRRKRLKVASGRNVCMEDFDPAPEIQSRPYDPDPCNQVAEKKGFLSSIEPSLPKNIVFAACASTLVAGPSTSDASPPTSVTDSPTWAAGPSTSAASPSTPAAVQSIVVKTQSSSVYSPTSSINKKYPISPHDIFPVPKTKKKVNSERKSQAAKVITGSPYRTELYDFLRNKKQTETSAAGL
ncbi:hypothetical protein FQA39_LY07321 [Lamprigera yunnana]|nr:hypothetical protein FQA39_LY07321 [Lamprigera yunnana]